MLSSVPKRAADAGRLRRPALSRRLGGTRGRGPVASWPRCGRPAKFARAEWSRPAGGTESARARQRMLQQGPRACLLEACERFYRCVACVSVTLRRNTVWERPNRSGPARRGTAVARDGSCASSASVCAPSKLTGPQGQSPLGIRFARHPFGARQTNQESRRCVGHHIGSLVHDRMTTISYFTFLQIQT